MHINLPEHLSDFIQSQVKAGGYHHASEYIRFLVESDQQEREVLEKYARHPRAEALVLEGLESGEPTSMTAEDWQNIRDEVRRRHQQRQQT